jgi:hypothetical protein
MAQPPVFRTIDKDDLPELKKADRLLQPLSQFMEATGKALDGGLTPRNFAAYVRSIEVVGVDEDQGAPAEDGSPPLFLPFNPKPWPKPVQMVLGEKGKPFPGDVFEVRVVRVIRQDQSLPGPVSVEGWQVGPIDKDGRRTLTLPRINGLAPNVRYTLQLLIQASD